MMVLPSWCRKLRRKSTFELKRIYDGAAEPPSIWKRSFRVPVGHVRIVCNASIPAVTFNFRIPEYGIFVTYGLEEHLPCGSYMLYRQSKPMALDDVRACDLLDNTGPHLCRMLADGVMVFVFEKNENRIITRAIRSKTWEAKWKRDKHALPVEPRTAPLGDVRPRLAPVWQVQ